MTCRCYICGRKQAGKNNVRHDYLRAGFVADERYGANKKEHKRASHRMLRRDAERMIAEQLEEV